MLWSALLYLRFFWRDRGRVFAQMEHIGVAAAPLALITGFFAGSIIAWQGAYQLQGLASLHILGGQAAKVIVMEIGPALTALVMAGRVGASMTAEIGSMKITEQIDALRSLSLDPVRFLVMPRLAALLTMMPALTLFANISGVAGAYVVLASFMDVSAQTYFGSVKQYFIVADFLSGVGKGAVFGVIIAVVGCAGGLNAGGGSRGVGAATVRSFVAAALLILAADYLLWLILF